MPCFQVLWQVYQEVVFLPLERKPPWPSFAILTADNPSGRVCSRLVNRCAAAALARRLRSGRYTCLHVCSPDLCYCEYSFAAPLPLHMALSLAARFKQIAVYYVRRGRLWLVPVAVRSLPYKPVALGVYPDLVRNMENKSIA